MKKPGAHLLLRHTSCHRRRTAVKKRTRKIQIRPSGSGFHLLASRHDTTRSRQDLQLLPRLQPAPLLHHLRTASPPARASVWPGAEWTTLKGVETRAFERGEGRVRWKFDDSLILGKENASD
jgi:hypothetical protein